MSEGALFGRTGHLHELAMFRLVAGELDAAERAASDGHLDGCALCRAQLDGLRAEVAEPLPPLVLPLAEVVPLRRRWSEAAPALATALSLAAVMLLFLRPPEATDRLASRGAEAGDDGKFHLEVYRDATPRSERLRSGDPVRAGDRLAFQVRAPYGGHLLVFGLDSAGDRYPVWPAGPDGRSEPIGASASPVPLDVGLELDDAPGAERIVATLCDQPFSGAELYPDLGPTAPLPTPRAGCQTAELVLPRLATAP